VKKSRFAGEQIAYALHQAETGTAVAEVIRKMGIPKARVRLCGIGGGMDRLTVSAQNPALLLRLP
jgi:hypothetical protein